MTAKRIEAEPIFFESRGELRDWLKRNHDKADELWVGFYKKGLGRQPLTYSECLDEALCFGWIDGVRKTLDEGRYIQRLSPRRPGSNWSQVNIKRAEGLIESGQMRPAGLAAFEKRSSPAPGVYSYENRPHELEGPYATRFRENETAWQFFEAQPPSYRRAAIWWVISARREETRLRRLDMLIVRGEEGRRLDMLAPGKKGSDAAIRRRALSPRR